MKHIPTSILLSFLLPIVVVVVADTTETITATTMTTIQTTGVAASPQQTALSTEWTSSLDFKTSILNSTNLYRYEHAAGYVYWNTSLADFAQKHSSKCQWEHTANNPNGENLARGFADVTSSVDAWGDERAKYDFSTSDPTGFSEDTGHFTQLVWKGTYAVGCGWTNCAGKNGLDGVYLVCEYWPAGNVLAAGGSGSSGGKNQYFVQNVSPQQNSGNGFNEASATRGATGGVPPASTTTGGAAVTTITGAASTVVAGIDIGLGGVRVWWTFAVMGLAVLMGAGMS